MRWANSISTGLIGLPMPRSRTSWGMSCSLSSSPHHCQGEGAFDIDDVAEVMRQKLVRRHPHVFGEVDVDSAAT